MGSIPSQGVVFDALVRSLVPDFVASGLTLRQIEVPAGSLVTIVYIADLLQGLDLQRFLLEPLSQGLPPGGPEHLARSGCFPAPVIQVAADAKALQQGLFEGLAALHVDGHPSALLLGTGQAAKPQEAFGPDVGANVALIRRTLASPDLRVERITGPQAGHHGFVYLHGVADPNRLQAMRKWVEKLEPKPPKVLWWQALTELFRLPPVLECTSPAAVADNLRTGYIAVLADHRTGALIAPLTLEQLLAGCQDVTLPPSIRRLVKWPRLAAAMIALSLTAFLVAIASYHHTLIPAPFLIALAAGRGNQPFPIVGEILIIEAFSELMYACASLLGGRRWSILGALGTVLGLMTALQAGVFSPVPVMVGIFSITALQVLPNATLARFVRIWRYLFILSGFLLGVFGIALLLFTFLVYLGEERPFGHPVRRPLTAVSK